MNLTATSSDDCLSRMSLATPKLPLPMSLICNAQAVSHPVSPAFPYVVPSRHLEGSHQLIAAAGGVHGGPKGLQQVPLRPKAATFEWYGTKRRLSSGLQPGSDSTNDFWTTCRLSHVTGRGSQQCSDAIRSVPAAHARRAKGSPGQTKLPVWKPTWQLHRCTAIAVKHGMAHAAVHVVVGSCARGSFFGRWCEQDVGSSMIQRLYQTSEQHWPWLECAQQWCWAHVLGLLRYCIFSWCIVLE